MKQLWQKYFGSDEKKRQNFIESWEKTEAKGHPKFVLRHTFIYGISFVLYSTLYSYLEGNFNHWTLLGKILQYFITGFLIGCVQWWICERKYQKLLKLRNKQNSPIV